MLGPKNIGHAAIIVQYLGATLVVQLELLASYVRNRMMMMMIRRMMRMRMMMLLVLSTCYSNLVGVFGAGMVDACAPYYP